MLESSLPRRNPKEQLYERIRQALLRYLLRRNSPDLADDIAHRAILVLLTRYADLERESDLLPLAIRCAQYIQLAAGREKLGTQQPPEGEWTLVDPSPAPEEVLLRKFYLERLHKALPQLKERCQTILRQRLLGKKTPEIAVLLQANAATLLVWESRCRASLQQVLGVQTT